MELLHNHSIVKRRFESRDRHRGFLISINSYFFRTYPVENVWGRVSHLCYSRNRQLFAWVWGEGSKLALMLICSPNVLLSIPVPVLRICRSVEEAKTDNCLYESGHVSGYESHRNSSEPLFGKQSIERARIVASDKFLHMVDFSVR